MRYSNLTNKSNIFLKRFTHSSRHFICSNIVNDLKFKTFLDFGTGDGQFFEFLKVKPNKKYFAYEPYKQMYLQFLRNKKKLKHVSIIKNKNNLKKNFYDVITVNEVIEHLTDKDIFEVIKILKKIAKKNSTIVISVPIEIGFSSLIKNLIRIFYNSKHENTTFNNLLKSIFRKKN
jgi:2-polyprenyl-3-methyl-5-hydroxy-6-metoxy-1,4-benzoquinol methylase